MKKRQFGNIDNSDAESKPYRDASLNIDGLATMMRSNRHQLSQVLNERLQKSFPTTLIISG